MNTVAFLPNKQARRAPSVPSIENEPPKTELLKLLMDRRRWGGDVVVEWVEKWRQCTVTTSLKGVISGGRSRSWANVEQAVTTVHAQSTLPVPRLVGSYVILGVADSGRGDEKLWVAVMARRARSGFRAMKLEQGYVALFNGEAGAGLTPEEAQASAQAAYRIEEKRQMSARLPISSAVSVTRARL